MSMVKVYYIGNKKPKVDNVTSSKTRKSRVWKEYGDSVSVPEEDAEVLLSYKDVWVTKADFDKVDAERKKDESKQSRAVKAADKKLEKAGVKVNEAQQNEELEDRDELLKAVILKLNAEKKEIGPKSVSDALGTNFGAEEINGAVAELKHEGKLPK